MDQVAVGFGKVLCNAVAFSGLNATSCYSYTVLQSVGYVFMACLMVFTATWLMLRQA